VVAVLSSDVASTGRRTGIGFSAARNFQGARVLPFTRVWGDLHRTHFHAGSAQAMPGVASEANISRPMVSSDEALMLAFCGGSEAAFAELFDRYAEPLRRLITRMTGNPTLSMDLVQSAFLSVIRARGRFIHGNMFKPWLYAIAINGLRTHLQRAKREVLSADGETPDPGYEPTLVDPGMQKEVIFALGQLPVDQREAVILHQFEGFSFAEIAVSLGSVNPP
jgi:RNA polymerase sigma factor (sigma-70 family)